MSGNAACRFWPSWSTCHCRSMSSRSCSDRLCIWARCSGVMELSIACMAAMRWAISSSSSSRFRGFSGKKSPWRSMKPSKSGSSPLARCSSIELSSASMSFIRAMSSGVMFCMDPEAWSTKRCMSCSRSWSISASNCSRASEEVNSYSWRALTWPARSGGRRSRSMLRCWTTSSVTSWRRWSPDSAASLAISARYARSFSTTSRRASAISS